MTTCFVAVGVDLALAVSSVVVTATVGRCVRSTSGCQWMRSQRLRSAKV